MQGRQLWFFSTLALNQIDVSTSSAAAKSGFDFLERYFRDRQWLVGLSWGVSLIIATLFRIEGAIFLVIGPNGAGKSTLFNLIAGVLPPTQGSIIFDGEDVTALPGPEVDEARENPALLFGQGACDRADDDARWGKRDHKILAVSIDDPEYASYREAEELSAPRLAMLRRFFQDYKVLEGKTVEVDEIEHAAAQRRREVHAEEDGMIAKAHEGLDLVAVDEKLDLRRFRPSLEEAAGEGLASGQHSATLSAGQPGVLKLGRVILGNRDDDEVCVDRWGWNAQNVDAWDFVGDWHAGRPQSTIRHSRGSSQKPADTTML